MNKKENKSEQDRVVIVHIGLCKQRMVVLHAWLQPQGLCCILKTMYISSTYVDTFPSTKVYLKARWCQSDLFQKHEASSGLIFLHGSITDLLTGRYRVFYVRVYFLYETQVF